MKTSIKKLSVAIALSALIAGPASAMVSDGNDTKIDVRAAISAYVNTGSFDLVKTNDAIVAPPSTSKAIGDKKVTL